MNHRTSYASYLFFFLLLFLMVLNSGCGGAASPNCGIAVGLAVAPPTASADHLAASPGNKISFVAGDTFPQGCIPRPGPLRLDLHWTVSNTTDVTIGNTQNVDYGVATCINATSAPVTVTATGTNGLGNTISGTAALACQ
jgi:hypothetical protein